MTAVNKPELLIVPALALEVAHVTLDVMSWVVPPAKVATALNCWVLPSVIVELVGVTAIEVIFANAIVIVVEPLTVPDAAVIVAVPGETPVTNPVVLMLAIVESEVDQKALLVKSCVVPSLKVPVAAICKVLPCWNVGVVGPTVRVDSVGFTKNPLHPAPNASASATANPPSN